MKITIKITILVYCHKYTRNNYRIFKILKTNKHSNLKMRKTDLKNNKWNCNKNEYNYLMMFKIDKNSFMRNIIELHIKSNIIQFPFELRKNKQRKYYSSLIKIYYYQKAKIIKINNLNNFINFIMVFPKIVNGFKNFTESIKKGGNNFVEFLKTTFEKICENI